MLGLSDLVIVGSLLANFFAFVIVYVRISERLARVETNIEHLMRAQKLLVPKAKPA